MRAFDLAASTPWAIEPTMLQTILEIADRETVDLEAIQQKLGRPLANTRRVTTRDGVAIVPVSGPIFRYANVFTEISGATSNQVLATDLRAALDDPEIRAILMTGDTPGGMVNGTSEIAQLVHAARGVKPIWAYVEHAHSAGYWILSAAERLIGVDTAEVGNIGVVAAMRRQTAEEKAQRLEIVSSRAPNKRLDPESDAGKAQILALVDAAEDVMVAAIAKHRGVDVEKVTSDFGRGGSLSAAAALTAGMIDGLGTFEATLAELAATSKGRKRMSTKDSSAAESVPVASITASYIAEKHPTIAEALRAEGKTKGVEEGKTAGVAEGRKAGADDERKRILAIQLAGKNLPGFDKLVADMIADPSVTAEAASARLVAANGEKLQGKRDALETSDKGPEASQLPAGNKDAGGGGDKDGPASLTDEALKAAWEKDPKLRGDFASFAGFAAYARANASGLVSLLSKK